MTTTDVLLPSPPPAPAAHHHPGLLAGTPVVLLRDGSVQVGCDPDRAVRLTDPPEGTLAVLARLTGEHTREELSRQCAVPLRLVDDLVEVLDRHRLLACAPTQDGPLAGTAVARLVSDVALGTDLALTLLAEGVQRVQLVDPRGGPTVREAVRRRLPEPSDLLDRLEVVDHVSRRPLPPGTPTILATGRLEPDPVVVEAVVRHDDPHMVVRPRPGGALLGPFVLPGRTSCLACADLARAALDPTWVEQRAVLTSTRADFPAPLGPWLVSTVVAQLACWTLTGRPDLVDRTVEIEVQDWRQRWRAWRPHPRCGCS